MGNDDLTEETEEDDLKFNEGNNLSCDNRSVRDQMPRRRVNRTSVSSVPSTYSSTDSESESKPKKPIRRRRRKQKTCNSTDTSLVKKSGEIENALLARDGDKLAQLAVSPLGLLSDEIRVRAWPRLMGIEMIETDLSFPTDEEVQLHSEYNQVVLDVNRSLKRFPPGIGESERPALQEQLTRLIIRVIIAHPHLHYYQGYHDVAITFLLVVGEELGYQIMERLSISHLKDFMAPTMQDTVRLLQYMYPLFKRKSVRLHDHLVNAELGTIFALPWLITWFGHVLPDYGDVVRLYDFFLAQPPMMPIYLAAAIVLYREEEILNTECEMSSVHGLLSHIPQDLPFEKLLVESQLLYELHPPHTIKAEVETEKGNQLEGSLAGPVSKFFLYTAPILIGVLVFKLYYAT